jgi:type II secretory pathway pseudopilin PulG
VVPLLLLSVLQELHASSQAVGNASAQVVALQVLEAAVSEFSLVTASPIGLSWEYHENCRNMFEVSRPSADVHFGQYWLWDSRILQAAGISSETCTAGTTHSCELQSSSN